MVPRIDLWGTSSVVPRKGFLSVKANSIAHTNVLREYNSQLSETLGLEDVWISETFGKLKLNDHAHT